MRKNVDTAAATAKIAAIMTGLILLLSGIAAFMAVCVKFAIACPITIAQLYTAE